MNRRWRKRIAKTVLAAMVLTAVYVWRYELAEWVRDTLGITLPSDPRPAGVSVLEWCEINYKEEVEELSEKHQLPYEYLMSLIVLECKGNKPAGWRFEKHIYNQLKRVKEGKQHKLEDVHRHHLEKLDDEALKKLATSWGPFQLMGYKAIGLDVKVNDLKDEDTAAEIGVQWIEKEYGRFLKKKKFKDAFHYHNTGHRFPLSGKSQTHNPYYVSDGLKYMEWFKKRKEDASKDDASAREKS